MPRVFSAKVLTFILLAALADLILVPVLRIGFFYPVFMYLVVLYAIFEGPAVRAIRLAVIAGVVRDAICTGPLGVETTVLFFTAVMFILLVPKIEREALVMRFCVTFLFTWFVSMSTLALSIFVGAPGHFSAYSVSTALGVALSTSLMMPVVFFMASKWFGVHIPSMRHYELFE